MTSIASVAWKFHRKEQALRRQTTRKQKKALGKSGAYARTLVRRSMKSGGKKGKASKPGEPPRYQETQLLRKLLWAEVEQDGSKVTVGPLFRKVKGQRIAFKGKDRELFIYKTTPLQGEVPSTLERGGTASLQITSNKSGQVTNTVFEIKPRPYLSPVVDKAMANLKKQILINPL